MEFPQLGKHCSYAVCNKLDFLPVTCDACKKIFCHEHMWYGKHECEEGATRDVQVPVCPLCNKPVPTPRNVRPDESVGAHIDSDCQSNPAVERRKIFTNKCSMKGCKRKEMMPLVCKDCRKNFCLSHRHGVDHNCVREPNSTTNTNPSRNTITNLRPCQVKEVLGDFDEDEALALAIALSLEDTDDGKKSRSASNFFKKLTPLATAARSNKKK